MRKRGKDGEERDRNRDRETMNAHASQSQNSNNQQHYGKSMPSTPALFPSDAFFQDGHGPNIGVGRGNGIERSTGKRKKINKKI